MTFLDVASFYLPGYELLSNDSRKVFEKSREGIEFIRLVKRTMEQWTALQGSASWWSLFLGNLATKRTKLINQFKAHRLQTQQRFAQKPAYQDLIRQLIFLALDEACPHFERLVAEDQWFLAQQKFSRPLQALFSLNKKMNKAEKELKFLSFEQHWLREKIQKLKQKKLKLIEQWFNALADEPSCKTIKKILVKEKKKDIAKAMPVLSKRSLKLAHFFSPLHNQAAILQDNYRQELQKIEPNILRSEEQTLTLIFYQLLQSQVQKQMHYLNLHYVNLNAASDLARLALKAFNEKKTLELAAWLLDYQKKILSYQHKTLLMNIKQDPFYKYVPVPLGLSNSLSMLYLNAYRGVSYANWFISSLAEAHAFIQATGFSTQNENSVLAILDFYNYWQRGTQVQEIKNIFIHLCRPFFPLYKEYKIIALYESNPLLTIVKAVLPLAVLAFFIAAVAALFSTFVASELAMTIIIIPSLYIGLFLATQAVVLKNKLTIWAREAYYGGQFKIPEYQINARIIEIFKNENAASMVREFYIRELQAAYELRAIYALRERSGQLSKKDLELRNANLKRLDTLHYEWYDIHSNKKLGYDEVGPIVCKRFREVNQREQASLKAAFKEESQACESHLDAVLKGLTTVLKKGEGAKEIQAIASHSPRLFKPTKTLAQKAKVDWLAAVAPLVRA